jgi:hypothetical protein
VRLVRDGANDGARVPLHLPAVDRGPGPDAEFGFPGRRVGGRGEDDRNDVHTRAGDPFRRRDARGQTLDGIPDFTLEPVPALEDEEQALAAALPNEER